MMALLNRWSQKIRPWSAALATLVFPPCCPGCRAPLSGSVAKGAFCEICTQEIEEITPPFCSICAEPFRGLLQGDFRCPNCEDKPQPYRFAMAGGMSSGPLREAIHQFKYGKRPALRYGLARLMHSAMQRDQRLTGVDWLLVPVPLHHRRFRERGFNQSEELAQTLSRLSGLDYCSALRRIRYTTAQATLELKDRQKNLKNAFKPARFGSGAVSGRSVLLIDDVFTTGSTSAECARVLLSSGAKEVAVLAVARG